MSNPAKPCGDPKRSADWVRCNQGPRNKVVESRAKSGESRGKSWKAVESRGSRAKSRKFPPKKIRVFGEGVKSARGETAILGRGDHARNLFGTSLHTADFKQTIALETAEIMQ